MKRCGIEACNAATATQSVYFYPCRSISWTLAYNHLHNEVFSEVHVKSYIAKFLIALLVMPAVWLTGCPSQNQYAALAQTLGATASSIAAIENNPALAAKITTDTAAAVAAIQAFKPGSNSQDVIQVINIVIDDINLVPNVGPYAPLVTLALGTAESLIALFAPASTVSTPSIILPRTAQAPGQLHAVDNAKDFKAQVKAFNKANPNLIPVKVN
jgi:hypothetical protein